MMIEVITNFRNIGAAGVPKGLVLAKKALKGRIPCLATSRNIRD